MSTISDDVADVDANAEFDPLLLRQAGVAFGHPSLDIDGTADRVDNAWEVSEHPIAGALNDPPPVLVDLGAHEDMQMLLQLEVGPFLVQAGQPAVASDIGCENGREPTLHALAGQGTAPRVGLRQYTPVLGSGPWEVRLIRARRCGVWTSVKSGPVRLQLVHPGGIKDAAGERNYSGFTVASSHGRSVP
jgi:hypothetical protein